MEIIRGRSFEASDFTGEASVTVVSETMARVLWPAGEALGGCLFIEVPDRVRLLRGEVPGQVCATVVGVAEDVARGGFQDAPGLTYYIPFPRLGWYPWALFVRAEGEIETITAEVATLLRSFSPEIRYSEVQTLEEILKPEARSWTLGATMFKVRMLGQNFVLFRDTAGVVHCLHDVCVHRGASLAEGKLHEDCIQCPYHGWRYDGTGACRHIPTLAESARIPARARVDSYPTVERFGLIFAFLGDLPEVERPQLMDVAEWGNDGWSAIEQHWELASFPRSRPR